MIDVNILNSVLCQLATKFRLPVFVSDGPLMYYPARSRTMCGLNPLSIEKTKKKILEPCVPMSKMQHLCSLLNFNLL